MMGFGYGMGALFSIVGLLVNVLLIAGVVYLVVRLVKGSEKSGVGERTPEKILAERYARGEISDEEYRHRIEILRDHRNR
ncbi:SHOCT domain-containing protein [Gorillibacterium timonense]|uniref:SHOCT domain-containing protein n=1 Tax=Gorillibacterium timonense TaxID=1689269 RepID=UPI00071DF72B|nr:SHOCT domain-containing protein [Gorillibacterium timonense]